MNEETLFFGGLVLIFAVILWLEWRYGLRSLRLGTAALALVIFLFLQPLYHAAWRIAISTPPAERVMHWPSIPSDSVLRPLSEYESGVFTMYRAVATIGSGYARERWLMIGVLFWLACAPVFRRAPGLAHERRGDAGASVAAPEA